ncbi:hypothetical protein HanRHA438_Chr01g0034151 [Helianthus annuus]|nr:hypothetical protein HanRHA438_Chr01g0034151 [Helianthus annuus]
MAGKKPHRPYLLRVYTIIINRLKHNKVYRPLVKCEKTLNRLKYNKVYSQNNYKIMNFVPYSHFLKKPIPYP